MTVSALVVADDTESLDELLKTIGASPLLELADCVLIVELPEWHDAQVQDAITMMASFNHPCLVVALNGSRRAAVGELWDWLDLIKLE